MTFLSYGLPKILFAKTLEYIKNIKLFERKFLVGPDHHLYLAIKRCCMSCAGWERRTWVHHPLQEQGVGGGCLGLGCRHVDAWPDHILLGLLLLLLDSRGCHPEGVVAGVACSGCSSSSSGSTGTKVSVGKWGG